MIRTRLLSHWAGKKFEKDISKLNEESRKQYFDCLLSLLKYGFWMTDPEEKLLGFYPELSEGRPLVYKAPMTCFTELRPTLSAKHSQQYGLLGIVVDRSFVLQRCGGAVHYVRSHKDDFVVGNILQTIGWLKKLCETKHGTPEGEQADALLGNIFFHIAFLKGMSDPGEDNFIYLDEHEWRIVHSNRIQADRLIKPTNLQFPKYSIPISPVDISMLILPDSEIRNQVIKSDQTNEFFNGHFPPLITTEELQHL